jgi:divalent metal cation (Fe/Co/Zn/Cd) transporter
MMEIIYNLLFWLGWTLAALFGIDNWILRRKIKKMEDTIAKHDRQINLHHMEMRRRERINHQVFAQMLRKMDTTLTSSAAAQKVDAMFERIEKETPKPDADETHN